MTTFQTRKLTAQCSLWCIPSISWGRRVTLLKIMVFVRDLIIMDYLTQSREFGNKIWNVVPLLQKLVAMLYMSASMDSSDWWPGQGWSIEALPTQWSSSLSMKCIFKWVHKCKRKKIAHTHRKLIVKHLDPQSFWNIQITPSFMGGT